MKVTLIGIGGGGRDTMTLAARQALAASDLVIGAGRMLEALPPLSARLVKAYLPEELLELLEREQTLSPCVIYSGDTGFYSGATALLPRLQEAGYDTELLPGISSLQYLSALLGRPWQDWRLVSAHGKDCDPIHAVMGGQPVLFLTSGEETVKSICTELTEAGLGGLAVTLGENLSYENQRVRTGTAEEFCSLPVAKLNVLLAEPAPRYPLRTPGLPDGLFLRDKVPMTKQEVRSVILAKLGPGPEEVCWDIGAGTGSVSVELSRVSRSVWAVEQKPEACSLIRRNREKFCAWNLKLIEGRAPEALSALPAPDAVFLGGSNGQMSEILEAVCAKNPRARICISAIALESLQQAVAALTARGYTPEVTQISVSRTKVAGGLHMLTAQNPVFLIGGEKP